MTVRVTDFALIIGHVWRCTACRAALLAEPTTMWVGFKLSEEQRACLAGMDDDDFRTITHLASVTGMTPQDIDSAIDHPRARLRHLGSVKGNVRPGVTR
jgi:hypothetical protein